jgi:hypothetical protein
LTEVRQRDDRADSKANAKGEVGHRGGTDRG